MSFQNNEIPIITVPVAICDKNGKPAVEIRKSVTDTDIIRYILTAAYRDQPIIVMPNFRDKLQSLDAMQKKEMIKYNFEDDEYHWLI